MEKLIFATSNQGKIKEIQKELSSKIEIIDLVSVGITEDIPEPFFTFQENAYAKANYVFEKTGINCFAEDSGLVVPSLHNEPGVFSARYAGDHATDEENLQKLLKKMKGKESRKAYYVSVICCIIDKKPHFFEGKCHGHIATQAKGNQGFGYDPIFIPKDHDHTFAELDIEEKNKISHRGFAMKNFLAFLNEKLDRKTDFSN